MNGYRCVTCKWLGDEPHTRTAYGDPAAGEAYRVVIRSCPDCGSEDLREAHICPGCEAEECEPGYDSCSLCLIEDNEVEPEEFQRDQVQPVKALLRGET